jgi:hypothetical protein
LYTETPSTSEGSRSLVNWTRRKLEAQRGGEGARQRRLADAGNVLEEQVAARQQRRERQAHDLALAAEDGLHLLASEAATG